MSAAIQEASGSALPDADHVLRYIARKHVDAGVINGSGFLARPREEAPSVNWLDYFSPPVENQVAEVSARRRLKYEMRGRLARINVGATRAYVAANSPERAELYFAYDPLPDDAVGGRPPDPSHAQIRGVPKESTPEGELIGDLMCDCILDSYPVTPDR